MLGTIAKPDDFFPQLACLRDAAKALQRSRQSALRVQNIDLVDSVCILLFRKRFLSEAAGLFKLAQSRH